MRNQSCLGDGREQTSLRMAATHILPSLLLLFSLQTAAARRTVRGCDGDSVQLSCPQDQTVNIIRANYGRLSQDICSDQSDWQTVQSWSTRCIQPRTLREVSSRCSSDGASHCSLEVSSQVFGDPCPDTPKYLEVVYTCQRRSEARESPSVPDWILKIKSLPPAVLASPVPTLTTTTTTENSDVKEQVKFGFDMDKLNFPESLPLLTEEIEKEDELEVGLEKEKEDGKENEETEEDTVYINQPKASDNDWSSVASLLEDERILPAVIVISISIFILGVVGVYLVLHKKDTNSSSEVYTIVKLDTNHYPQYNFLPDREGNLYHVKSVSSEDSSHNYYQII